MGEVFPVIKSWWKTFCYSHSYYIDTDKLKKVGKMFEHVSFQHLYRELNDHVD